MHVLDNPVWHALVGPHAGVAERVGDAARYVSDVAVFCALPDETTPAAWDDLRTLVGAGGAAFLVRDAIDVPDGWTVEMTLPCRQMMLPETAGDRVDDASELLLVLGENDVREMLALVERTRPGPFATTSAYDTTAPSSQWRVSDSIHRGTRRSARFAPMPTSAGAAWHHGSCARSYAGFAAAAKRPSCT